MDNITQVNNRSGRLYEKDGVYAPSVTNVLDYLPTPQELQEWVGNKGWDMSRQIMAKRATEGSIVHDLIERMICGEKFSQEEVSYIVKKAVGSSRADAVEYFVKKSLLGFMNFCSEYNPKNMVPEAAIFWEHNGKAYAGTVDLQCTIDGELWVIDFKTSKNVFEKHHIQCEAYRRAVGAKRCGLLKLPGQSKKCFTLTETKQNDYFWEKFGTALSLYYLENPEPKPDVHECELISTFSI